MPPGGTQTSLWEMMRKLWRRKWLVVTVALAFVLAGLGTVAALTPRYGAEIQILIGVQPPRVVNVDAVLSGISANSETVQSEAYVIESRAIAEAVARRLNLDRSPEFNPRLRNQEPGLLDGINFSAAIAAVREWFSPPEEAKAAEEDAQADGRPMTAEERKWDRVISRLIGRVEAVPLNRSHVVSLSAESENPQLAARIANTFADVYIERQLARKQQATTDADQWLEKRIADLRKEVEQSDRAVEDYRREHRLYETKSDTIVAQQLSDLNRELIAAQNARAEAESRLEQAEAQLKGGLSTESLPAVLQSPLINTLRGQQSELEQKSAQLSSVYTEKHPMRRDVRAQIKDLSQKIRTEVERIVDSLRHAASMAGDRYNRIKTQMVSLESRMGEANEETVTLRQLEREADANRAMLTSLMQRSRETVGQQSLQVPDATIISAADVPLSPKFPPTNLIIILSIFAGVGCGILAALFLENTDQTFHAREEVEERTGLPVLALMPTKKSARYGRSGKNKSYTDTNGALQMLNTRLSLDPAARDVPSSILFTSALAQEGKTSISAAFARHLAQEGQRVMILELDWKRPNLHKVFGQPRAAGLADLLHGFVTPEEAVYRDPETGLHAIFAGDGNRMQQGSIWLERLRLLLGTLSRHYDVIILDTAPVAVAPEVLHIARLVQQTVFVVKWGSTPKRAVANELQNLIQVGAHIAGIVLSQVDLRRYHRHAYGEGDYSYRRYAVFDAG